MPLPDEGQLAKEVVSHALHAPIDAAASATRAMVAPSDDINVLKAIEAVPDAAIRATGE